jgi:hypothetical protein
MKPVVTTDMQKYVEKEITSAISHCQESAAALATVAVEAMDKRADAICKQMELTQALLNSVKALVLNMHDRIEALETARPCE